jgi:hypothetical protein
LLISPRGLCSASRVEKPQCSSRRRDGRLEPGTRLIVVGQRVDQKDRPPTW